MKILYGVQGTGNGHISRARALNRFFRKNGVKTDFLFSGRKREAYFDMEEFGDWDCREGLTFIHEAGKVKTWSSLKNLGPMTLIRDIYSLDLSPYDIVLTDFEPIVAWAAKLRGVTCIGIGHQYAFQHNIPLRGHSSASLGIMKSFAPVKIGLGLHWHHFGQNILPPIAEVRPCDSPVNEKKILVYPGFEDSDEVIQYLEQFDDYQFVYYGPFKRYESLGHIKLKPLSRDGFQFDLATSLGVICNAGFELSSEAIQSGKKLLVKPLAGQMEQLSNARALEELQLGMTMNSLDKDITRQWLDHFQARRIVYPNVAEAIVRWVLDKSWQQEGAVEKLAQELWHRVESDSPETGKHSGPRKPSTRADELRISGHA